MGFDSDAVKVGLWGVEKPKIRKKKDDDAVETGCWLKFRFLGKCMPSGSKVESSISGSSTQDGILLNHFNYWCMLICLQICWYHSLVQDIPELARALCLNGHFVHFTRH